MYRLIFESGRRAGQVFDADKTPIVDVGRDPSCKIMLEEPGVSRRNTIIQQLEDGVYISDLSSTNGTYVNGVKIPKETRLKPGDHIEIGSVKIAFQLAPAMKPGQLRRRGKLFTIALLSICGIIVIELIALGIVWLARHGRSTGHTATGQATNEPPTDVMSPPPDSGVTHALEEPQQQLTVKLDRVEQLAKEISQSDENDQSGVEALDKELKNLRAEIDSLKANINEIAAKTAAPAPPSAVSLAPPRDPIQDRAAQMISEADRAKMMGQFDDAIRVLQGALVLVPNYAPAYKAMAEIYEMRGLNDEARATWQKIVAIGPSAGAAYAEASQHLQEMARKEASSKLPEVRPLVKPSLAPAVAKVEHPRNLRIVETTKVLHPEDTSVDERYEVKFLIRAQTGEKFVATEEVKLEVKFYDRLDTGEIVETNAETTEDIKAPTVWESFDRKPFTVQYRAAKGLRKKETEETGKKRRSYGYIVRVSYRGKLQDERSEPDKLLSLLAPQASPAAHNAP